MIKVVRGEQSFMESFSVQELVEYFSGIRKKVNYLIYKFFQGLCCFNFFFINKLKNNCYYYVF